MLPISAPPVRDQLIQDYWRRRASGLSTEEWEHLYRLVVPILMATRLPPRYADPQVRRDLVVAFFSDKIFANAATSHAGPLHNVHALHRFLKNYASDVDAADALSEGDRPADDDGDDAALATVLAAAAAAHQPAAGSHLACGAVLAEAGLQMDQVVPSAAAFIDGLDSSERAYLGLNTCADEHSRQPVSGIAARLALGSSYHYKARQLGITRSKGDTFHGYHSTKIGK